MAFHPLRPVRLGQLTIEQDHPIRRAREQSVAVALGTTGIAGDVSDQNAKAKKMLPISGTITTASQVRCVLKLRASWFTV